MAGSTPKANVKSAPTASKKTPQTKKIVAAAETKSTSEVAKVGRRGRPKGSKNKPKVSQKSVARTTATKALGSVAPSLLRATVLANATVGYLSTGLQGAIVAGSSIYVDSRLIFADGSTLCVIPGSLIFVDTGASPSQVGLATTAPSSALRVTFEKAADPKAAPYKAVVATLSM